MCKNGGHTAFIPTHLELSIGPPGNLHDHVQNGLLLIGIEGDVVEGRDRLAILLDENAMLEGVGGANLPDRPGRTLGLAHLV